MNKSFFITFFTLFFYFNSVNAQGPELSYFFEHSTILPWAKAELFFRSGSCQNIKLFPVNASFRGPLGTNNYTKDIDVKGKLIICLGVPVNLKKKNSCYDFKDKIVLLFYDQFANNNSPSSFIECVSDFSDMGVKAIVVFSIQNDCPVVKLQEGIDSNSEIPVISIDNNGFKKILSASGYDSEEFFHDLNNNIIDEVIYLISSLRFSLKGKFEKIETPFLTVRYNNNLLDHLEMKAVVEINNRALDFIYTLFKSISHEKRAYNVTYFSDYDEKLFYTSHWGKGLAHNGEIFSVFEECIPTFELAVHEFTHTFFYKNWGGNSSFLSEGVAMFAQNRSINSNENNIMSRLYLEDGKLLPLERLVELEIGEDEKYTTMGYFASGSFTEFLIEKFGLCKFLDLWKLEKGWANVYKLTLSELEKRWHQWLKNGQI